MRRFIWEDPGWPALDAKPDRLAVLLDEARRRQFAFLGALSVSPSDDRLRATIENSSETAIASSEIEGEHLSDQAVRSSVARRLGVKAANVRADERTEGVVEMTLDAVRNFEQPLSHDRLRRWHAGLFPVPRGGQPESWMGAYRSSSHDPMRVISGPVGRETVHYEAPPAGDVPEMMMAFLDWFNGSRDHENGLVRVATAHLWFETIHPFVDGNGRIGRAISDLALAQDERSGDRFYSLSSQIARDRNAYYDELERAQKASLDTTAWVEWFVRTLMRAIEAASAVVDRAKAAGSFWDQHADFSFNDRQRRVLFRILGEFEGNLNVRTYMAIAKTPRATAQRDLSELVQGNVLITSGKGKATHYHPIIEAASK